MACLTAGQKNKIYRSTLNDWLYHSPLIRLRQRVDTTHILYAHTHTHTLVINGYLWATIINDVSVN